MITTKISKNPYDNKRTSVSAEVYGVFNKKENFVPRFVPKSEAQNLRISECVKHSFLFNSLEKNDLQTVIGAMEEKTIQAGETVINQGENGDVLYIIENGTLDCNKTFNKEEGEKYLKTYSNGEVFGELALLYNAPRAATIKAKENAVLWALDRETFNNIVKDSAMKKREKYENFLRSVEILKSIDSYEIAQISDALKIEHFKAGETIIKQNEEGDKFYILESVEAYATILLDDNLEKKVKDYQHGECFGELALMKNELRAANVIASVIFY